MPMNDAQKHAEASSTGIATRTQVRQGLIKYRHSLLSPDPAISQIHWEEAVLLSHAIWWLSVDRAGQTTPELQPPCDEDYADIIISRARTVVEAYALCAIAPQGDRLTPSVLLDAIHALAEAI